MKIYKERKTKKIKTKSCLFTYASQNIFIRIMTLKSSKAILDYLKEEYVGNKRIRKEGSGVGSLTLKIDLEKAYDRVRWDFLESTLVQFGFPSITTQLIMWGLKNSSISLLWNGSKLSSFVPSCGLRQGDPLSPYLFVFCMERLTLRISELLQEGHWKPIQLSPGGFSLSHLFFADDILLFCQASEDQARLVASILEELSRSSGLRVNLSKSKFVSSRRVSQRRIDILEGWLGIGHTARIGKYLGVPMTHG
uniref:LINE-1 reverse transcriptase isogeny n=1 Tax=Cajanus cajan TaxID=3821 RepID=A0A151U0T6_CAJCA|nr:LINE-1 reverse transcriptase isogeny [Cajanus cajan]